MLRQDGSVRGWSGEKKGGGDGVGPKLTVGSRRMICSVLSRTLGYLMPCSLTWSTTMETHTPGHMLMAGKVRLPWNVLARLVQRTLGSSDVRGFSDLWVAFFFFFFVAVGEGGNGLGLSQQEIQRIGLWSPSEGIQLVSTFPG